MTLKQEQESESRGLCPQCDKELHAAVVKTALWCGDRVFIVEDIPAQVCGACQEQFYDERAGEELRRMVENGFALLKPEREITVPIFSLESVQRRRRQEEASRER